MSEDGPEAALRLARDGDVSGAARMLTRYLETKPGDAMAHWQLAKLSLELGDAAGSVQAFEAALDVEPDNVALRNELGIALEAAGRESEAAEAYRRALESGPPYPPAQHNLALILGRHGHWPEAVALLRAALAEAPGFDPARRQLGRALRRIGREQDARDCFEALLDANANDIEARRALADMDMDACRYADAARQLEQCIALAPADAGALLAMGSCLQELGRVDEALEHYRRLLRSDRSRYYEVVKKLTGASRGRYWVNAAELRRELLG